MQRHYPAGMLPVALVMAAVGLLALLGSGVDRICDRVAYLAMVRLWIPRRTFRGARPQRFQTWGAERLYQLSETISSANTAFDRIVSRLLVDSWWSAEPAKAAPQAASPEMAFRGAVYWATHMDKLWDQAATSVMVDMWVPEPGEAVTLDAPGPSQPSRSQAGRQPIAERRGRMRTPLDLLVGLVSTMTVQAWLPESATARFSRQTVEDRDDRASEKSRPGLAAPSTITPRPEAGPTMDEEGNAVAARPSGAVGKVVRLVQGQVAGPGMILWRAALVIMGTAVLIVVLLVALGYLRT